MNAFSQDLNFALAAIWKVLLVSVILGAGLPALYAAGVRSLAMGTSGAGGAGNHTAHPVGKILAALIFAVIAYAVASAILFIIASGQGKTISFEHLIPVFAEKPH